MKLLPREEETPRHSPWRAASSIDSINKNGVSYVTCTNGVWHVDGYDMLTFVVVRGSLKLQVSYLTGDERQTYGGPKITPPWIAVEAEHQLVRGDVICLWGLYAHRAIGKGDMALVNLDCAIPLKKWLELKEHFNPRNRDIGKVPLYSPQFTERLLISHLKNPDPLDRKKTLWTRYSAVLNGR